MPGLPDLQAQILALQTARAAMEASLTALSGRLDEVAGYAIAGSPALIATTLQLAQETTAVVEAIEAYADGVVSRTYLDSLLP